MQSVLLLKDDWMTIPDLVDAINFDAIETARRYTRWRPVVESLFGQHVLAWICCPSQASIKCAIGSMIYRDNCTAAPISERRPIPSSMEEADEPRVKLKISESYKDLLKVLIEGPTPENRRRQLKVITRDGPKR